MEPQRAAHYNMKTFLAVLQKLFGGTGELFVAAFFKMADADVCSVDVDVFA